MNIKHLNYFVVLAREKHFAKAAEVCNVTQPTLSAGIAKLEQELTVQLVLRNKQFIGLTEFGQKVLKTAETILAEQMSLKQAIQHDTTGLSGRLKLAIVPQSSVEIMPKIKQFQLAYPQVSVAMSVMTNQQICSALTDHSVGLGLGFIDELSTYPHLQTIAVTDSQPELAILYHESLLDEVENLLALTQRESVGIVHLAKMPLCLLSSSMQFRQKINAELTRLNVAINCVFETESLHHLINAVVHKLGIAIVTLNAAKIASTSNGLNFKVLQGIETNKTGLILNRLNRSVIGDKFIDFLR